jgi:hypothetical protein
MNEQDLYRELVAWLRSRHPLVLTQWERERQRRESQSQPGITKPLLEASSGRSESALDRLSPDADKSTIVNAIQQELMSLGISGGTPGVTADGAPCVHLMKKGLYGRAYEESVTLARIRDPGYRRHLREVFG